jgi:hypothetical protein
MKDAPHESTGHQAHPQSISHSGQAKPALPGLAARGRFNQFRPDARGTGVGTGDLRDSRCDTTEEVTDVLHELCEEIFVEQLAGWFNDTTTWPPDRGFEVFCRWFDYQHHSVLIDLCDEPLIRERN